jgi:hypothetical protein
LFATLPRMCSTVRNNQWRLAFKVRSRALDKAELRQLATHFEHSTQELWHLDLAVLVILLQLLRGVPMPLIIQLPPHLMNGRMEVQLTAQSPAVQLLR